MKFFLAFLLIGIVSAEAVSTDFITKLRNNPTVEYSESLLQCVRSNQAEAGPAAQGLLQAIKDYDALVESANDRIDECIAISNPIVSAGCLLELSVVVSNEAQLALDNIVANLVQVLAKEGSIVKKCIL